MAHHKETQAVNKSEGLQLTTTGTVVNKDWDDAWDSDDEEQSEVPAGTSRSSMDEERRNSTLTPPATSAKIEDEVAEAWGWGGKFYLSY